RAPSNGAQPIHRPRFAMIRSLALPVLTRGRVVYHRVHSGDRSVMATSEQQIETHDELIDELREIVGDEGVLSEPEELLVYECDGLPQHKHPPRAVVFPNTTEETADVVSLLSDEGV